MSRTAALLVLLLALGSGLVASVMVMRMLNPQKVPVTDTGGPKATAIVATAGIPAGTAIQANQIDLVTKTPDLIPKGAVLTRKGALGRVTKAAIYPGEVILQSRLARPGSPDGLPALIPIGYRAVSLRVDPTTSVGGFILPGSYVDVLTTIELPGGTQRERITKTILQNVKVLATGQELEKVEEEQEGPVSQTRGQARTIPTVTILVSLEQAERLTLADDEGEIRLVLRSHADRIPQETAGVTLSSLIPQAVREVEEMTPIPVEPSPFVESTPTPRLHRVRVISGGRTDEKTFRLGARNRYEPMVQPSSAPEADSTQE